QIHVLLCRERTGWRIDEAAQAELDSSKNIRQSTCRIRSGNVIERLKRNAVLDRGRGRAGCGHAFFDVDEITEGVGPAGVGQASRVIGKPDHGRPSLTRKKERVVEIGSKAAQCVSAALCAGIAVLE